MLIAEVGGEHVVEIAQDARITRLGTGVDGGHALHRAEVARTLRALDDFAELVSQHNCSAVKVLLTSAVRDAANGSELAHEVQERTGWAATIINGREEGALAFAAASADIGLCGLTVVLDIGGGSTEIVVGDDGGSRFSASMQLGTLRQAERHFGKRCPNGPSARALLAEVQRAFDAAVPERLAREVAMGLVIATTPTWRMALRHIGAAPRYVRRIDCERGLAAFDGDVSPFAGLPRDRLTTIVAGMAILLSAMRTFALEELRLTARDLLHAAAASLGAVGATAEDDERRSLN